MSRSESEAPKRILRVLSVITAIEGGLGLAATMFIDLPYPFHYAALSGLRGGESSRSLSLLYLLGLISTLFSALLLASSALLWKLRRKGLALLSWTLVAEVFCFFGITFVFTSRFSSNAQSYMLGMGLMPFTPQIVTAFPILAGILIYRAYRHLGIPPHESQMDQSS